MQGNSLRGYLLGTGGACWGMGVVVNNFMLWDLPRYRASLRLGEVACC